MVRSVQSRAYRLALVVVVVVVVGVLMQMQMQWPCQCHWPCELPCEDAGAGTNACVEALVEPVEPLKRLDQDDWYCECESSNEATRESECDDQIQILDRRWEYDDDEYDDD